MTSKPTVRIPPATQGAARAVAAPAAPALGVCTLKAQSNRCAWLHIAAFLDAFPHRPLEAHARRIGALEAQRTAEGAPLRGEVAVRVALSPSLPVGNHGENLNESQA